MYKLLAVLLLAVALQDVAGHGMLTNPPGRSSVWRFYSGYPTNYNDNQNFCGGLGYMASFDGRCGVCGDKYTDSHPQANENTGIYGQGKVTGVYRKGQIIDVTVTLTANHKGTFKYSLCILSDPSTYESGENCFKDLLLADGSDRYYVGDKDTVVVNRVKLPSDVICERCVLRWHYKAANSWGICDDGSSAMGCGYQETFRSCADITIS